MYIIHVIVYMCNVMVSNVFPSLITVMAFFKDYMSKP
jgi:hypothetical protein